MTEIDLCKSMAPSHCAQRLQVGLHQQTTPHLLFHAYDIPNLDLLLIESLLIVPSTFLKRKGGLFKKAHELSVLCSVEVAVIIFGHNKKLYEYSSGDINETIDRFHYVSAITSLIISRLTILTVWWRT